MNLVLAITNYNRLDYLKYCLSTWDKFRDKKFNWTLIIADDGSSPESINFLEKIKINKVKFILIKNKRHGMCHQTNQIFLNLLNINYDVCFKLDNDVFFINNGWEKIYLNSIEKYGYDHLIYDNPKFNLGSWCHDGKLDKPVVFGDLISYVKTMYAKGCFFTITPKILKTVGFMDTENFFHGWEHIDYSHRCARAGFNNIDHPFDHKDSNLFISYRFPWNKNQQTISKKLYQANSNSITNEQKKKKIIKEKNRIFVAYKEVERRMKDYLKIF
jgi:glycosyltransferase involved in cell wall biosynthesis